VTVEEGGEEGGEEEEPPQPGPAARQASSSNSGKPIRRRRKKGISIRETPPNIIAVNIIALNIIALDSFAPTRHSRGEDGFTAAEVGPTVEMVKVAFGLAAVTVLGLI
jgi:hypothetical protein